MKSLRAESLTLLLCFALGLAAGGVVSLAMRSSQLPESFDVEPLISSDDDPGLLALDRIDDPAQRHHALLNVLSRFATTDLDRALACLPQDNTHDEVLHEWVTQRLIKLRPDLATSAAARLRDAGQRHALIVQCAHRWRRTDSAKTAQWLREHLDASLAQALTREAMNDDPAFLARLLTEAAQPSGSMSSLEALFEQWFRFDPSEALRFMETMPVSQMTPGIVTHAGQAFPQLPAARVQAWLARLSPSMHERFVAEVLTVLPKITTVADAHRWLNEIKTQRIEGPPVVKWFRELTTRAPDEAQRSLDDLSSAWERDDCIEGCITALGLRDRAAALDWTEEIGDPARRFNVASFQWKAWWHEAGIEAVAWLGTPQATVVLTATQRRSLDEMIRKGDAP